MGTPEPSPPGTPLPEEMLNYNIDEINAELEKVTNEINIFENEIDNIDDNADKKILNKMLNKCYDKHVKLLYIKGKLQGEQERQQNFNTNLISKLNMLKTQQDKLDLEKQEKQEAERYTKKGGKRSKKRRTNKRRRNSRRRSSKRRPRK